jgi:tRNA(Ile)-lysidine synthase
VTEPSLLERVAVSWPPETWRDVTVVVAVSGGADSVALFRILHALQAPGPGKLAAAHFNHRTRGPASEEDERYVRDLAEQLGVVCLVGNADAAFQEWDAGDGFEAAARTARYAFLTDAARQLGARYVATAHTADDQAETVLHRILRGTGVGGLAGIPRVRRLAPEITLIRPLLTFRREELRAYLTDRGQTWREDASNANLDWTRNRIRHELLPQLARDYNPAVVDALLRLGNLAREAQEVIQTEAELLAEACLRHDSPNEVIVDAATLQDRPVYLVCELLIALWRRQGWPRQHFGWTEWRRLAEMARSPSTPDGAEATLPGAIRVRRQGVLLSIRRAGLVAND